MANVKKQPEDLKKHRGITLSDKQVQYIKTTLNCGLTAAMEKFIEILKGNKNKGVKK